MPPELIENPINFPYTAIELTEEIEVIPNTWGRLQELGIFGPPEGIATLSVEIAYREGSLKILEDRPRGTPAPAGSEDAERSTIVKLPHFPYLETIKPADLQDRVAFGTRRKQLRGVDQATARKLMSIRRHHALTREWLRMGALKGLILDGTGKPLLDLYDTFEVPQKVINFELSNPATNVLAKCEELRNHMQLNLLGETMNGIHVLVDQTFFNALAAHPNVEKFFLGWQQAAALAGAQQQRVFNFSGINFEPYIAVSTGADNKPKVFIEPGEGHAFPLGTSQAFRDYNAPPDHVLFANTLGVDVFVSPKVMDHGQGVELKSESSPLPICSRPALLVKLLKG